MPLAHKAQFGEHIFHVWENVYEPAEDSFLFAENLQLDEGDRVVDIGTGCGILGIIAAERAREVLAVDVNPYAVGCAKENAELNGVSDKMSFIQGDLFASIESEVKFDLILFNAPYLPSDPAEDTLWFERAWSGGVAGREIIDRFIRESAKHVMQNGRILLMQSSLSNINETLRSFEQLDLKADVAVKLDLFFETVVLIEARLG